MHTFFSFCINNIFCIICPALSFPSVHNISMFLLVCIFKLYILGNIFAPCEFSYGAIYLRYFAPVRDFQIRSIWDMSVFCEKFMLIVPIIFLPHVWFVYNCHVGVFYCLLCCFHFLSRSRPNQNLFCGISTNFAECSQCSL